MSAFEILRERVDLVEVAGRYTDLRTCGRSYVGSCPRPGHTDSDPSFNVYGERFYCYGCRWHGDVTDFWAEVNGIEPGIEAAFDLAREYGAELPQRDLEAQRNAEERRNREAGYLRQAEACHKVLSRHATVAEWWEGRGFDQELCERFLLGANRDGTAAVIPYWHRGRIQGLIRRKLSGEPKYLYPKAEDFPEGHKPLFIPGPIRGGVFLVEGPIDALAVAALGEGAIAVGATGISREQMRELQKLSGPLYVLPDADAAGEEAARGWVRDLYPKALLCPPEYGEGSKDG